MGPKKNISTRQISMSFDDSIETDDWHCAVSLIIEKKPSDYPILNQFPTAAFRGLRPEIKSINYDLDIIRIVKQFISGEIDYKYSRLLQHPSIFEEAADLLRKSQPIPCHLLVQIIKALILILKEEDINRNERKRTNPNDPIKAMVNRPAVLNGFNKKNDKKPDKKDDRSLKLKPPSVGKEDTLLLKRGEGSKESEFIDDAPKNSYYQLYIVLTGFYDPNLALELIKAHIPVATVICFESPLVDISARHPNIENFWGPFLKSIWNPENVQLFKDTVFQVYAPEKLSDDVQNFIYSEISFLMYDLSDLKRQHGDYLQCLKLMDVGQRDEKLKHVPEYQEELDSLPCEYATVPVVLQYILDVLCGDDDARDERAHKINYVSMESEAPSMYTKQTESSLSFMSPNSGQIFEGDVRYPIYQKIKSLDERYDLQDEKSVMDYLEGSSSISEMSNSVSMSMLVRRERLYAENLEDALRGGVKQNQITSCWKNLQPICKGTKHKDFKFPPVMMDYSLYLLWMQKVTCRYQHETKKIIYGGQNYTVTESARADGKRHGCFSAPELKIIPPDVLKSTSTVQIQPFISDLNIPERYLTDEMKVYEDIRTFLGEDIFQNANGFEFVEELGKKHLEDILDVITLDYNCIDCSHSALTDSVLLVFHKRKGEDGAQRETYNVSLKTSVGLRDFYDYVLEDEKEWIKENEERYRKASERTSVMAPVIQLRNFRDEDFISENSLKSQRILEDSLRSSIATEKGSVEDEEIVEVEPEKGFFYGYDISSVAVQYSGLNTFFSAADNCSVEVELQERLYGKQQLKLKIRQGGHTLFMYSYACPKPHIQQPYTCHILHKSGMIIAFTRRTIETYEEIEEVILPRPMKSKSKKLSQEQSQVVIKRVPISVDDDRFFYNMKLSLPSGLTVEIVRNKVDPSYVKQHYVVRPECYSKTVHNEKNRLFLPNGEIVKMYTDNTIQVLRTDGTIINSLLEPEIGAYYDQIMSTGEYFRIIDRDLDCTRDYSIFENLDIETNISYYRRTDGTNYALYPDGTFCVYFKDGTKISTSIDDECEVGLETEEKFGEYDDYSVETGEVAENFVLVHLKRVFEHPDYATVVFDTSTKEWTVGLPFEANVKATMNGCYSGCLDNFTYFHVNSENVFMSRCKGDLFVKSFVDLTVFENGDSKYCETVDSTGKSFVVESNGNSYVEERKKSNVEPEPDLEPQPRSEPDLKPKPEPDSIKRKLCKENRYFVIRRDKSGFELVHKDSAYKTLSDLNDDTILYSQNLPGQENKRFFVILNQYIKHPKWEVPSVIPPFNYPDKSTKKISSTYGVPPSWMHPFHEKPTKITVPDRLTARVLVELTRTDFQKIHSPKFKHCTIQEPFTEVKFEEGFNTVQKIMRKIAADDQNLLRDLYISAVTSEIEIANSTRSIDSQKLEHYLKMSEYYNRLKKFHKDSIKNHVIPNYFTHPAGLSWLILQEVIDGIEDKLVESKEVKNETTESSVEISGISETVYDLDFGPEKNYSELSFRSWISSKTAPAAFERRRDESCEGRDWYVSKSEPGIKYEDFEVREEVVDVKNSVSSERDSRELKKESSRSCFFTEEDLKVISNLEE